MAGGPDGSVQAASAAPPCPEISVNEIRATVRANQLRLLCECGADMTISSPRASAMAPYVGEQGVAIAWLRVCNHLIARMAQLYPDVFAAAARCAIAGGTTASPHIC